MLFSFFSFDFLSCIFIEQVNSGTLLVVTEVLREFWRDLTDFFSGPVLGIYRRKCYGGTKRLRLGKQRINCVPKQLLRKRSRAGLTPAMRSRLPFLAKPFGHRIAPHQSPRAVP